MINSQARESANIEFTFENDHEQYMSLSQEKAIPLSLELRAKAALAELSDIQREFELHRKAWEEANKEREDKFDDAMSHFQDTKCDWVRHEDSEGNVHWINTSYMNKKEEKPLPFWPFGDTSDFY